MAPSYFPLEVIAAIVIGVMLIFSFDLYSRSGARWNEPNSIRRVAGYLLLALTLGLWILLRFVGRIA